MIFSCFLGTPPPKKKKGGRVAISNFVPFVGDPRECRVYVAIGPPRRYVATSHFVFFIWEPWEHRGYVAILPIFGPREGWGCVATCPPPPPSLGTPENACVMQPFRSLEWAIAGVPRAKAGVGTAACKLGTWSRHWCGMICMRTNGGCGRGLRWLVLTRNLVCACDGLASPS